jgi:hypothetical protein
MLIGTPNHPDLAIAIRTLVGGGFVLANVQRKPGYVLLHMDRPDEFGAIQRYCLALAEDGFQEAHVAGAKISADHRHAQLVLVGRGEANDVPTIDWDRFLNLFGGPIFASTPFEPQFTDRLTQLGFNQLPEGMEGKPDDLYEAYARVALEFVLGTRVIRYGQDRLFEARPDGIVLPYYNFAALYDTKAYAKGYEITVDTIRQFCSYVEEFQSRYRQYLQQLSAFIVISSKFPHRSKTLVKRSRELFATCGVPLVFLTSETLGEIVAYLSARSVARSAINWRRVFVEPIITTKDVQKEVEIVGRDEIIRVE